MKNQKLFVILSLLFVFIFCFMACSKSSKAENAESGSVGSSRSVVSGGDGSNGITITVIGIPNEYNGSTLYMSLEDDINWSNTLAAANIDVYNGRADNIPLYDPNNDNSPLTKTGKYFISIELDDGPSIPVEYNLKRNGNIFDFKDAISSSSAIIHEGIKITLTDAGSYHSSMQDGICVVIYDKNGYGVNNKVLANAWGTVDRNGSVDLYLDEYHFPRVDPPIPWKKTGDFYIRIGDAPGSAPYYYLANKKIEDELVFKSYDEMTNHIKGLPTYNLKSSGNFISFQDQFSVFVVDSTSFSQ